MTEKRFYIQPALRPVKLTPIGLLALSTDDEDERAPQTTRKMDSSSGGYWHADDFWKPSDNE